MKICNFYKNHKTLFSEKIILFYLVITSTALFYHALKYMQQRAPYFIKSASKNRRENLVKSDVPNLR